MSKELTSFFESQRAEIDRFYADWASRLPKTSVFYESGYVPPKLTVRQRIRIVGRRVRSALAAPFARVVKVLDPSRLDRGDC